MYYRNGQLHNAAALICLCAIYALSVACVLVHALYVFNFLSAFYLLYKAFLYKFLRNC